MQEICVYLWWSLFNRIQTILYGPELFCVKRGDFRVIQLSNWHIRIHVIEIEKDLSGYEIERSTTLKWIHDIIEQFIGNKGEETLLGHSAGKL